MPGGKRTESVPTQTSVMGDLRIGVGRESHSHTEQTKEGRQVSPVRESLLRRPDEAAV